MALLKSWEQISRRTFDLAIIINHRILEMMNFLSSKLVLLAKEAAPQMRGLMTWLRIKILFLCHCWEPELPSVVLWAFWVRTASLPHSTHFNRFSRLDRGSSWRLRAASGTRQSIVVFHLLNEARRRKRLARPWMFFTAPVVTSRLGHPFFDFSYHVLTLVLSSYQISLLSLKKSV